VSAPRPAGAHIQLFSRTDRSPVRWRLLSANNREAGRGVEAYVDVESCRVGIKELQSVIDDLDASVRRLGTNQWAWQLALGGEPVAVSSRGFDRMIRCEQGLAHFLEHARSAEIGTVLMVSSSRRW
jgi:hypothetical protein